MWYCKTQTIVESVDIPEIVIDKGIISLSYSEKYKINKILDSIDKNRLVAQKTSKKKAESIYSLEELKNFSKQLGIKPGQNKKELIRDILELKIKREEEIQK